MIVIVSTKPFIAEVWNLTEVLVCFTRSTHSLTKLLSKPDFIWWGTLLCSSRPLPYTLSRKLLVPLAQLLVPHSWRALQTRVSMLSSPWKLHDCDLNDDGALTEVEGPCTGGFSDPRSEGSLKACAIIKSLYFISVFFRDLPLKEDLTLTENVRLSQTMNALEVHITNRNCFSTREVSFKAWEAQHPQKKKICLSLSIGEKQKQKCMYARIYVF